MSNPFFSPASLTALEWPLVCEALEQKIQSPLGKGVLDQFDFSQDIESAQKRQTLIQESVFLLDHTPLGQALQNIQDPRIFFPMVFKGASLTPLEIWISADCLARIHVVEPWIQNFKLEVPQWNIHFENLPGHEEFLKFVSTALSPDGTLLDHASPKLQKLRRQRAQLKVQVEEELQSKVNQWHQEGLLQDRFYDVIDGHYVVPVRSDQQKILTGSFFRKSQTGLSLYIEPSEFLTVHNDLTSLDIAIKVEENQILRSWEEKIKDIYPLYEPFIPHLAELDFTLASAQLVQNWALHPLLDDSRNTFDARWFSVFHPLLKHQGVEPVRNHFQLKGRGALFFISGPNTGGKTVLLKAAGIAACMAKLGLFIPASSDSTIPAYDGVCALIGDDQNLEQGLSSFSAHIHLLKSWLSQQQPGAFYLILIDEILSSTNPEEGSALAQAILEEFLEQGHHIIVTSHWSELAIRLKQSAHAERIQIGAMEFESGHPTYRLRLDEIGHSHAIETAAQLGLPAHLIERAQSLVSQEKQNYQKAKAELQTKEQALEQQWQEKMKRIEEEKRREIFLLKLQCETFLQKARAELQERLRSPADKPKIKFAAQKVVQTLEQESEKIFKPTDATHPAHVFQKGDAIQLVNQKDLKGSILSIDEKNQTAFVQLGNFKMKKLLSELEPHLKINAMSPRLKYTVQEAAAHETRLDLRGKRYEEALREAEVFLDWHFRQQSPFVEIITGHGTGALKQGLRELLKSLSYVQRSEPAREGDDGAVRVYF